jgi:alkanesulfonate monooxygenase SsuD/methylene tetrahydromethanopterin reductase-like flavin-dependent oxidoreductase (luciferase family)
MEFGVFCQLDRREGLTEHETFEEWLALAETADSLGFDCFWLAEFHFRPHSPLSAPLVLASAIASRTNRIKVGIAVQLLPLANPVRLAEECATLDHVSGGRLVYGIGRSSFLDSYRGYNVDYELSRPMFFEALDVIRKAWRDEPLNHEGEYYSFRNVNVVPKPYQKPHPPVRIACESRATFPMMGKLGFPIMIRHQMELPQLRNLLDEYEAERHAAGFGGPNQVTLQSTCYIAETAEQAIREPEATTLHERRIARLTRAGLEGDAEAASRLGAEPPYEELIRRRLYGTPEAIVDRLREYEAALGVTGVSLNMNPGGQLPPDRVLNSLRLFAEQVAPRFA